MANSLGIDVPTKGKGNLIRRLHNLKSTIEVEDGGCYHQDPSYSQVHIVTTWDESQLDSWLYRRNLDYVGVFEREGELA